LKQHHSDEDWQILLSLSTFSEFGTATWEHLKQVIIYLSLHQPSNKAEEGSGN